MSLAPRLDGVTRYTEEGLILFPITMVLFQGYCGYCHLSIYRACNNAKWVDDKFGQTKCPGKDRIHSEEW